MEFNDIEFDTFMNMSFEEFINLENQNYVKVENDMVSLNNDMFSFLPSIPYNDFISMDFEDFSNAFINSPFYEKEIDNRLN